MGCSTPTPELTTDICEMTNVVWAMCPPYDEQRVGQPYVVGNALDPHTPQVVVFLNGERVPFVQFLSNGGAVTEVDVSCSTGIARLSGALWRRMLQPRAVWPQSVLNGGALNRGLVHG
jgi:hypothetical protein